MKLFSGEEKTKAELEVKFMSWFKMVKVQLRASFTLDVIAYVMSFVYCKA